VGLRAPSEALARRILTEVGWEERLEGCFEAPMRGPVREFIYRFSDAANLLTADATDPWSTSSGVFGYFDFGELQAWVRDVFGDGELADRIAEIAAADCSLKERIERTKPLMDERLRQCRQLLGISAGED